MSAKSATATLGGGPWTCFDSAIANPELQQFAMDAWGTPKVGQMVVSSEQPALSVFREPFATSRI
jgi:hypothetical protein